MQLGRKLAEGYALDPEADELEPPIATPEEQAEPERVELPARV